MRPSEEMTTMMMMTALMIEHDKAAERMAELDAEMAEMTRHFEKIDAELTDLDDLFD
jgi:predicted  nucleic acid-binding Zn-ribbon protein